ncbi:secreted RxLR effector protein 161-like [Culex quinquefasciatus]|uniref:secreted RxLR effector protein 161-like n=1 Tax=Culex quinquefasciatus TaxID=7176 RepID=UPI0018E2EAEB|nr:secreted RxLR effector protein 161-like [Culex quinquefasciatus]
MYLTVTSRPDICPAVNYFASFQSSATEEHWVHLKRVLRYLQGTLDYKLVYQRTDSVVGVEAFADADWGNDPTDRKSVSGFVLKLHGQTVNWSTRKQTSVALSSTEAELMSLCQASCEVMWMLNLLASIEYEVPHPVTVYEDNQPCISVTADPRKLKRMKHIDVQYRFVKELIDNGKLRLQYLSTEEQVADLMTKGLAAPRFKKLREMLGIAN